MFYGNRLALSWTVEEQGGNYINLTSFATRAAVHHDAARWIRFNFT
jgi:hypothetical protein